MKAERNPRNQSDIPSQEDPRWKAVADRDRAADGTFYYSVETTGVYCLPSCAARPARPENVRFHLTRADAERVGFRACKRCKPDRWNTSQQTIAAEVIQFAIADCSLGLVLVARSEKGVSAVLLGDDRDALRRDLQERFPRVTLIDGDQTLDALGSALAGLVESPSEPLDLPLDLRGTAFQRGVWEELRQIPAGQTASYSDIAVRIGLPSAARAVAQACAANALAIVVPCHRVVRSDGRISGYRWGVERKRSLLNREERVEAAA